MLLEIRDRTGMVPHVYFSWTESNPFLNLLRLIFVDAGEVAPVTREVGATAGQKCAGTGVNRAASWVRWSIPDWTEGMPAGGV